VILDGPTVRVRQLSEVLGTDAQRLAGVQAIESRLRPIRRALYPTNVEISGEEAYAYLTRIVAEINEVLRQHAGHYTWHRWLWYLRRVPDRVFQFKTMNTPDYDRAVAETVAGAFGSSTSSMPDAYPIEETSVRRVLRFCGMCLHLSDAFGALQWAGAGARFRFTDRALPDPVPSELDEAIRLYISRLSSEFPMFARLGIVTSLMPPTQGDALVAPLFREKEPRVVNLRDVRFPFDETVEANYHPIFVSINDVLEFLKDAALADAQFSPSIAALFLVQRVVLTLAFADQTYAAQMLVLGVCQSPLDTFMMAADYVCANWSSFLSGLPLVISVPQNGKELINALAGVNAVLQPLKTGPLLAVADHRVLIDVAAASQRMYAELEAPTGAGRVANFRSRYFELAVQGLIDRSPSAPADRYRDLRGRTLRRNGRAITDVDAIAERPDHLLLISCKSIPFSGRYDAGDYAAVRNAASLITDEVNKHAAVVRALNESPSGDNYHFAKPLLPVVCIPHTLLLPIGPATAEMLQNLRAVASTSELVSWCQEAGA